MNKFLAVPAAAALGVLAVPAVAYAHTSGATICRASFTAHPENASPSWANDTFVRITTIRAASEGTWKAHITDLGHFTTIPGTKSDSGDTIQNAVTGLFAGRGDYTVTSAAKPHCVPGEHYSGSGGPTTGQWPVHYFTDATTSGIDPWHWDYRTCREHMSEDSVAGTTGHLAGLKCRPHPPKPTPTPTTTDTGTPSPTPSTSTSPGEAPVPTPVNSDLPVTG
jgi:hypothetical protein